MSAFIKFILRQHPIFHLVAVVIIATALTFVIQRYAYQQTTQIQQQKIKEYYQLESLHQDLVIKHQAFEKELLQSNTTLENQKHELDVQNATIQQLDLQFSSLQKQLASVNKELLFYQTITQGDRSNKLQIRELDLRADAKHSDIVHYRLVITQGAKIDQALTGSIEMVVNSFNAEKLEPIFLSNHKLNLRHVQLIEGQIKIGDSTIPENIIITIMQQDKTVLTQSFNWQLSPPSE